MQVIYAKKNLKQTSFNFKGFVNSLLIIPRERPKSSKGGEFKNTTNFEFNSSFHGTTPESVRKALISSLKDRFKNHLTLETLKQEELTIHDFHR